MEIILDLTRPARGKGGDRYEAEIKGEVNPLVIYLPQSITRESTIPHKQLILTITNPKGDNIDAN